jgi:hypothetical protein
MVPEAAQQPPPLQLLDAHVPDGQHPLLGTAAAQPAEELVASCATWHP